MIQNTFSAPISEMTELELENYKLHRRFDRMGRLVGDANMAKLMNAHVMIIGVGGVGSWAAESLARSGVGTITLVDFDEICVTNFNRQIHSLQGLVGKQKAIVMAERLRKINPQANFFGIPKFYYKEDGEELLKGKFHSMAIHDDLEESVREKLESFISQYSILEDSIALNAKPILPSKSSSPSIIPDIIIDAIDSVTSKCHLIATAKKLGIEVITVTGSGGKLDPTAIKIKDLSQTFQDPLARSVRKILRDQFGFPQEDLFGVSAVFSDEPTLAPEELKYDNGKGFRCVCPQGGNEFFNCDNRNVILGNASFVTGAFGLAAASLAVRKIISNE